MRHFKHQILFIVIVLYSCGQDNQNRKVQSAYNYISRNDTLFKNFDTLENKWNSTPVNFDTLYSLAKQLNIQADNYPNRKEIKLIDIYERCADIYRMQKFPDCDPNKSQLLCSKDTLLIIDCYKKAIQIFKNNSDSLTGSSDEAIKASSSFADAIFQLADVYEQLGKFQLALPLRQQYLDIMLKTKKSSLEMIGDAYMWLGSNYEFQKDYKTAYSYYLRELENRKADNYRDLKNVERRIAKFKREHKIE